MINYEDVMREKQRLQDEKLNAEKAKLEKEQKEKQSTEAFRSLEIPPPVFD